MVWLKFDENVYEILSNVDLSDSERFEKVVPFINFKNISTEAQLQAIFDLFFQISHFCFSSSWKFRKAKILMDIMQEELTEALNSDNTDIFADSALDRNSCLHRYVSKVRPFPPC